MARILILAAGHLWSNPRSQKEANTLAGAGHQVKIRGIWFDQAGVERDLSLASGKTWQFEPFLDLRPRTPIGQARNLLARSRNRMAREAYSRLGISSPALFGYGTREMLRTAIQTAAHLTIVRSEAGMWVANALLERGQRVGIDFEDWYSEDLPSESRATRPIRWLKELERRAAAECVYAVTTSAVMANAIAAEYRVPAPRVVYNTFPLGDSPRFDGNRRDRKNMEIPSVHWFSQTIGPGRGLELLFVAADRVTLPFEIHLRGRLLANNAGWFAAIVPPGLRERVYVHDTVPNEELPSRIAEHDIGLALEAQNVRSRNLTITNKLFQYMQAGLAIIATDTAGQREVFSQAPDMGLLIRNDDPDALARALGELLGNERLLSDSKQAATAAFEETFNWERQSPIVVGLANRAVSAQGH